MPKISMWNNSGIKTADYRFIDRTISEYINVSGPAIYIHKFIGSQDGTDTVKVSDIQDVLLLENRDRKYEENIYVMKGLYTLSDNSFNLSQFGLFINTDNVFINFHYNDTIAKIGRKLVAGDVIELPNQRDEDVLNGGPAINKYYVVEEVTRPSEGYSSTWYPHLLRIKGIPLTDSQEFSSILNQQATNPFGVDQGTLGDLISTVGANMEINEQVVEQARASFMKRNFESQQYYVVPGKGIDTVWLWTGDGIPPNGALLTGSGISFPNSPSEGDYFLRLDYMPRALFQFQSGNWHKREEDYRQTEWTAAHRILLDFISNDTQSVFDDGTVQPEKQPLFQAVKPRADF